ncbi:MAG: LptA/OstA family protein [Pseudomonadota bacterium]
MTKHSRKSLTRTALIWAAGGFIATAGVMGTLPGNAQSFAAHNTRAPVTYDAGVAAWDDRANRVMFSGGVVVTQAGLTVRSDRMLVNYSDNGALAIDRITASGGVSFTRGNERASGDTAIYDLNRRIITMAGNVKIARGGDTLNGGRLTINLDTGVSSVDGRPSGGSNGASETGAETSSGRVTGTFSVPQE